MFENGNIILHQIKSNDSFSIQEVIPTILDSSFNKFLTLSPNNDITWESIQFQGGKNISINNSNGIIKIDASVDTRFIIDNKLSGTNIYYNNERIGIGRDPMYTYKFDIAVPKNTLMTALHVGDGLYGFSLGNGTNDGFIPEIIGLGSDENDAGLYLIGVAGNDVSSDIPLIIIDGRNSENNNLANRPILGVTSAIYNQYKFIINHNGLVGIGKIPKVNHLEVDGVIQESDFVLDSSISFTQLINVIIEQKDEIDILNNRITKLEKIIKNEKIIKE